MRLSPQARVRLLVALFFAGLIVSGACGYADYGIGWDEPLQRAFGVQAFDFAFHGDPALLDNPDRYYGPLVETALAALERGSGATDPRAVFLQRHFCTFLLFCLGTYWMFRLATRMFGDTSWGLVAATLLAASPRIYADAFFNSKDIPLMVFFIGAMLALHRLLRDPRWPNALVLALACALAISTRVIGVLVYPVAAAVGLVTLASVPAVQRARLLASGGIAFAASLCFTFALWPLLWDAPLSRAHAALTWASQFPFRAPTLFLGAYVPPSALPWYYIPVWIGVTTPLAWLLLAAIGTLAAGGRLARAHGRDADSLLPLAWLLVPWAIIVAAHGVVYDGWRHVFFLYPALVLLAVGGLQTIIERTAPLRPALRGAVVAALVLALADVLMVMIRTHPHQNLYFNALVPRERERALFEMDYWGTTFREGLEYVLRADARPRIRIWVTSDPGRYNSWILEPRDRDRLQFVQVPADADYALTNFRGSTVDFAEAEVYSVKVNRVPVLRVYRGPFRP